MTDSRPPKTKYLTISIILLYLLFVGWWISMSSLPKDHTSRQLFAALYGVVALIGSIAGLFISRRWGFFRSVTGKALIYFSLGLFAQEFGQLAYSYYIYYLHTDVPYPSWGDLGYFISIPLYVAGVYYLAQASGVKISLNSFRSKVWAVILPMSLLAFSYYFFLVDYKFDSSAPLTSFLDFGYPFGEAIYLSLSLLTYLLTRKVLGGVMKNKVLMILFALVIQYIADFMFLYQAKMGTWYAGGVNDLIYLSAYTIMSIAIVQFSWNSRSQ